MFYHSVYVILIFDIVLFGQGFAINEINPSYYLICFFLYIYINGSIFLMNELSYWLSFPFRFILLLRRTMFVELGFHRRLGISQFLDCPRVSDEWKNRRYSRLPRMGSDISVNSGAFLFFWRLPDFRDGQRKLQLKLYAKALAYLFDPASVPVRITINKLNFIPMLQNKMNTFLHQPQPQVRELTLDDNFLMTARNYF